MAVPRPDDDEWWDTYGKKDAQGGWTSSEEAHALREYVEGKTSPQVAARSLMSIRDNWFVEEKGDRIADFIWLAAIQFAERQTTLLDLVDAILEMLAEHEREAGGESLTETWVGTEFEENWTATCDSPLGGCWGYRYPKDQSGIPDLRSSARLFGASSLAANLCLRDSNCTGILSSGFTIIMTTLEQDPWNHVPPDWDPINAKGPRDRRIFEYKITMLNTNMIGLTPWFLIAGHLIYNYEDGGAILMFRRGSRRMALPYLDADLWHGDYGYNLERWAFWKERLKWITKQDLLLENTRSLASKVVDHINEIEKDPQTERWKGWVSQY